MAASVPSKSCVKSMVLALASLSMVLGNGPMTNNNITEQTQTKLSGNNKTDNTVDASQQTIDSPKQSAELTSLEESIVVQKLTKEDARLWKRYKKDQLFYQKNIVTLTEVIDLQKKIIADAQKMLDKNFRDSSENIRQREMQFIDTYQLKIERAKTKIAESHKKLKKCEQKMSNLKERYRRSD
jgi:hypothetical protein